MYEIVRFPKRIQNVCRYIHIHIVSWDTVVEKDIFRNGENSHRFQKLLFIPVLLYAALSKRWWSPLPYFESRNF